MTFTRVAAYVVLSLFTDWLMQQPEVQALENTYAPRVPAVVAIVLVLAAIDAWIVE